MISVLEAKHLILAAITKPRKKKVPLNEAFGMVAANDVAAVYDHPLFDNSAVDGYAFRFIDRKDPVQVITEVSAGKNADRTIIANTCARIFTGASVPSGADTVVMQEYCTRLGDTITVNDTGLRLGSNIRLRGEQIKAGTCAVKKGMLLGPAAVGLLASVGVERVEVCERPAIAIVRTGNEFIAPGATPTPGKIFTSNDVMLRAAIQQAGAYSTKEFATTDDLLATVEALIKAVEHAQIVICTGGVSVGDHDLVLPALQKLGAKVIFHRIAQKPGKPMLFARVGNTFVFGLPGNPRAVMILFWEYVLPFLKALQDVTEPGPRKEMLPLADALEVKGDRAEFRAAVVRNGKVELLRDQGSHMLSSLIDADVLAYIPEQQRTYSAGDAIEVHWLPEHG